MTRHSKSNKDGSFFTYYERHNIRHGAETMRLAGASMKLWHHCALGLSTPKKFVVTPHGILYDREAIITALLKQKDDHRKETEVKELAEEKRKRDEEKKQKEADKKQKQLVEQSHFMSVKTKGSQNHKAESTTESTGPGTLNFWVPGAPSTANTSTQNQDENNQLKRILADDQSNVKKKKRKKDSNLKTTCPVTGLPLRLKHLIALNPTTSTNDGESSSKDDKLKEDNDDSDDDSDDDESGTSKTGITENKCGSLSFICPVCMSPLTNASKPVALRTGTVLCLKCTNAFVRKQAQDPVTGNGLDIANDVVVISNSGTAFAASVPDDPNSKVARIYKPSVT